MTEAWDIAVLVCELPYTIAPDVFSDQRAEQRIHVILGITINRHSDFDNDFRNDAAGIQFDPAKNGVSHVPRPPYAFA